MSVVIVGGNECMHRRYIDLCDSYKCDAKVYTKMKNGLKKIGNPDLMVVFTNTVSHKMTRLALGEARRKDIKVERCHSSSMTALRRILDENTKQEEM